jgi:hypothetical protein
MAGMAAFFAATAKAPTTSSIILFGMTNDYRIMLPRACDGRSRIPPHADRKAAGEATALLPG